MKSACIIQSIPVGSGRLAERLAESSAGRVALHIVGLLRRPGHLRWHWRGIARELNQIVAVSFAVVSFSIFVKSLTIAPLLRKIGEIPAKVPELKNSQAQAVHR